MHGKHADNACVPCGGDAAGGALREARVASGWSTPRPHGHCEPPPFWQAFAQAGSSRPLFDPGVYGAVLSYEWKDALWDKFTMGTPDNSGGTSRSPVSASPAGCCSPVAKALQASPWMRKREPLAGSAPGSSGRRAAVRRSAESTLPLARGLARPVGRTKLDAVERLADKKHVLVGHADPGWQPDPRGAGARHVPHL